MTNGPIMFYLVFYITKQFMTDNFFLSWPVNSILVSWQNQTETNLIEVGDRLLSKKNFLMFYL